MTELLKCPSPYIQFVFDEWCSSHLHGLFSEITIIDDPDKGPVATINVTTRHITVNSRHIIRAACKLRIPIYLFLYYMFSHEFAHILYQQTDKTLNEEYFAHDYAAKDCRDRLARQYASQDFDGLEHIRRRLIL